MVSLSYRTFKDQTFFSLLAVTVITVYLVFPAMLSGISEVFLLSLLFIPVVFMIQMASLVLAFNLTMPFALMAVLFHRLLKLKKKKIAYLGNKCFS